MLTAADLRSVTVFADQPERDLAWLASAAEERAWPEGARPFRPGMAADEMLIVLDGAFHIFTVEGGARTLFGTVRAGEVSGLLPFSRMTTFEGEGVALAPLRLAALNRRHFPELLARMPEVGNRLVARLTDRVREASRQDQQRERMMALGKLSAGLAHELNNPAAAIARAADALGTRLGALPGLVQALCGYGLSPEQIGAAQAALQACAAPLPGTTSPLDRADREDALADWLSGRGVGEAYALAETLADEGVTPYALDHLAEQVSAEGLGVAVRWAEHALAAQRLLAEVQSASGRISSLVASVKAYTHMDGAPVRQASDLHAGLDSTLTMLGGLVRDKGVRVERDYAADLAPVWVFPGEINQVWTNLLDNALDAAPPGSTLRLRTRQEGVLARIDVTDRGPGIPPEVQARIFDPFFTTKPPGSGTGLGLDIARRIVEQHEGTLSAESRPGETTFTVRLPADASSPVPSEKEESGQERGGAEPGS